MFDILLRVFEAGWARPRLLARVLHLFQIKPTSLKIYPTCSYLLGGFHRPLFVCVLLLPIMKSPKYILSVQKFFAKELKLF
jgi:hypothetical protein